MKPGLLLNASTIPQIRQVTRQGLPVALNRYVLDYWQHGQKQALVQANHLREGKCTCFAGGILSTTHDWLIDHLKAFLESGADP